MVRGEARQRWNVPAEVGLLALLFSLYAGLLRLLLLEPPPEDLVFSLSDPRHELPRALQIHLPESAEGSIPCGFNRQGEKIFFFFPRRMNEEGFRRTSPCSVK